MKPMVGLEALCASLYASVLEPERLQAFCAGLAEATGSHVGAVMIHDPLLGSGQLDLLVGADPVYIATYEREFAADNVWVQRGAHRLVTGAVVNSDEVLPREELRRSRYYNEFLRHGEVEQSVALCAYRDARSIVTATMSRSGRLAPYGEAQLALLHQVAPHWVNVHAIRRRLGQLERQVRTLEAALARVPLAMLLLDRRQRIVRMNSAAEMLLSAGWLSQTSGGLAARGCQGREWHRLLSAGVIGTRENGRVLRHAGQVVLRGNDGASAWIVSLHPLPPLSAVGGEEEEVALVFVQPAGGQPAGDLPATLRQLFGLTAAEAALASAFAGTADLGAAAVQCGIGPGTARTRFKVILAKTGESGQPGLMRLLSALASAVGMPS